MWSIRPVGKDKGHNNGEYRVLSKMAICAAGRSAIFVFGVEGLFLFLEGLKVR